MDKPLLQREIQSDSCQLRIIPFFSPVFKLFDFFRDEFNSFVTEKAASEDTALESQSIFTAD